MLLSRFRARVLDAQRVVRLWTVCGAAERVGGTVRRKCVPFLYESVADTIIFIFHLLFTEECSAPARWNVWTGQQKEPTPVRMTRCIAHE